MRFLPLILKNCLRNRRRSVLTILSLSISLCLLGVMVALYAALFYGSPAKSQARRLVTRHKVSIVFDMPIYYREQIRKVRGVEEVAIFQWFGGVYKDSRDQRNFFARMAIEGDKLFRIYQDYQVPPEQRKAFEADPAGCVVGRALAARHGFKLGDKILIKGDIFPFDLDLTVRAIYETAETNEDTLWFQFKYLENALRGSPRLAAGTFTILASDEAEVARIARDIDGLFANAPAPTKTESEYAFGLTFLSFLGNIKVILMVVCAAVTFTVLLISANTMAMSVRERVREVGVLKTLGFRASTILGIILAESAAIALAGGALGLAIAQGLCVIIQNGPAIVDQTKTLSVSPPVFGLLMGVSLLIGVASAIVPAWNASRTNIVEALRFSD
jgi:putative ABC transport system permease protein